MSFDEALMLLDDKSFFSVIYRVNDRFNQQEDYLEIAFSTGSDPSYFLWVLVDKKYLEEFTRDLEIMR